jgi:hypothetical protein
LHALQHDSNKAADDLNKLISRRTNGNDGRVNSTTILFIEARADLWTRHFP